MTNEYRIRNDGTEHVLVNPSGVVIATGMSWRVARRIADLLNREREQ